MKKLKLLFTVLCVLCGTVVFAHDFGVNGIYYNITNATKKTVAVTYKGNSYSAYSNEYTGSVVIPGNVTYNGTTYSVTSIGDYAFYNCTGLTSIVIPNSVTSIESYAFYSCTGLKSVTIGNSVTSIGRCAFYGCSGLTSITIPNSVTSIGSCAFLGCSGLTSITIPNSVKSIGWSAFEGCTGLTSVTIPNSVTSIGQEAFRSCDGLTSVTIGNSVTSIGNYAFSYCSNLKTVYNYSNLTFTKGSTDYGYVAYYANKLYNAPNGSVEGDYIFGKPNGANTLVGYLGNDTELTLPTDYKGKSYVIGSAAFYGNKTLSSVVIPNSVTSIEERAFYSCSGLTSVVIPNSVTSIGDDAFTGCSGLESIVVEAGNTKYDSRENCNAIIETESNTLIKGCNNSVIPNSVTSIEYNAFYNCSGLTSITIPNSVTSIGSSAFSGCTGLTSVVIPNSVTSIEYNAFYNCSRLTSVTIPNSVTSIEERAFYSCSGLTSVTIGNSVTSIGESTFYGCSGLTSVVIPNSVTSIGDNAFYNCTGLTSIVIPNSVTSIESYAFYSCTGLKSITIPNSVKSIGNAAFVGCSGLTSITIPNSVTSIGDAAFSRCDGLTSVVIPNSVTSIGKSAFYGCDGLTSVVIPNSVTSIGEKAFYSCSGLTSIVIPNSVTSIGGSAFSGCSGLTSVVIPNSVTSIGERAFYSCSGLTSIVIPNSVTSIGSSAFSHCTGLKTVYNYSNLTFTKGSTDYGCVAYYADKVYNTFEVPEERKYYKIKNVATGLYLQVSGNNTNMTLQEKSDAKLQIFTLEDAGKGKFYIKSTDADNCYYAHATTWNFNATTNANNKTPFKIALLDGETNIYTLYQNVTENVGLAGTDSSNAGAFVFCNKRAENNGKWAFEVFTDEDRIAALENAIANAESVLETRAQLLTNDEKKAISAAVQTANDEKGNTNADVTAEIARLTALSEMVNNAVGDAIYVNAIDEISNAVCYTVSTESRGAWYSEASNLNSTGKLNIAYNITDNKQQFAFIKSPKTGKYYLYSVSEAKFVSKNGDYTTLTETPVQTITFLTGERTASYPWIIALNTADGEKQIAVSNTFEYGIITFYNDLTDAGNTVRLEKVATFDATAALALIDAYENGETAIEEVNVENVNVIIYDLQGHRVKEITEGGIYIINGKKVLVK